MRATIDLAQAGAAGRARGMRVATRSIAGGSVVRVLELQRQGRRGLAQAKLLPL
ncbi:MAG: hypothetical protein HYZ20_06800 [Burkholderiales bacterium]|nr:hypothetical protein [Burkholderiales bacterium]